MTCSPNGTNNGVACGSGSLTDTNICMCNAGYYGDGVSCRACRTCDPNALTEIPCPVGVQVDTVRCTCNLGYYGDGSTCSPCKLCDGKATPNVPCLFQGGVGTSSRCTCNAGFYGDGSKCSPCRSCDLSAKFLTSCNAGSPEDTVSCSCNIGFKGDGFSCTPCANKTLDWLYSFCAGANTSLVERYIIAPGINYDICTVPTEKPCAPGVIFSAERAVFSAGDDTLSQTTALAPFKPAALDLGTSRRIVLAAFRKRAAGFGTRCQVDGNGGYSCDGAVPLLAVPGLLMWTVPGLVYPNSFAVTLNTTNPIGGAMSAATIFTNQTNSLNLPVALSAFPFVSANRRAVGCAAGMEWRYARLGSPLTSACACPANTQCAGATTCNIVPTGGEGWQVVAVPSTLCAPVVPALPPPNATVVVPVVSPSGSTSSSDLALGLGLGLGLGIPAILGGIIAFQLSRRPLPDKQQSPEWVLSI